MSRLRLDIDYESASAQALAHFPIDARDVELVKVSENVTFRIRNAGDGGDYVLRLHRPGYNTLAELNSERMWTSALRDAGLSVPGSLRSNTGDHFVAVELPDGGAPCFAGVTTWTEGTVLSRRLASGCSRGERIGSFRKLGQLAAEIHNQAVGWEPPPGFERPSLDLDGLVGREPRWGRFWEQPQLAKSECRVLARARERARDALVAYGADENNFSLIHADLHPGNVIVDGDDFTLIDYDDSAYGWHLYEIAAALIEQELVPGFSDVRDALVDGYRERRPLPDRDAAMLQDFLLLRAMAIIGWTYARPEHIGSQSFEEFKDWTVAACAAHYSG